MPALPPSKPGKLLLAAALTTACAVSAQTPAPQAANTAYASGAQRSGVSKCIGRINQITSFVTGSNAHSGVLLNAPSDSANQRIVSGMIEVEGGGSTSLVSASFAPGTGSADCSGTYDAITYWSASCAQVANSNFNAFKAARPLLKSVSMLDGGQFAKVFLMPAGSGCISIKKEMLY